MPLSSLMNQPLTIIHPGPVVEDPLYHDETTSPGVVDTVRGRLEQTASTESVNGRDAVVTRWRVFLPAGTQINAHDVVEFAGQRWQVDGAPDQEWNPRLAAVQFIVANLIAVEGE